MKKLFVFVLMSIFLVAGIAFAGPTVHRSGVNIMAPLEIDHTTETLSAARTILTTDRPILWFDCDGASRNVTLPAEASSTDLTFTIVNVSDGSGENLVIRDDTPTTLITVGPGQGARVSCDGTSWETHFDSGIYYDAVSGNRCIADGGGFLVGGDTPIGGSYAGETQVLGTGHTDSSVTLGRWDADAYGPWVQFVKSRHATVGSHAIVQDDDAVGGLLFLADDGVDFDTQVAQFIAEVDDANPAAGAIGAAFTWKQMTETGGAIRETMRLNADGTLNLPTDPTSGDQIGNRDYNDARYVGKSYGVAWDESADTYARTGTLTGVACSSSPGNSLLPIQAAMRRCVMSDAGVVQYYLDPSDSTLRVGGGAAVLTGADGQVMVEIPAFYYKYSYSGTVHTWEISLTPEEGFSLYPAFQKNGVFVAYRYIGAYEGVLYDTSESKYVNGLYLPSDATYTISFADNGALDDTITSDANSHAFSELGAGVDKIVVSASAVNDGTYTIQSVTDTVITLATGSLAGTTANDQCVVEVQRDWTAATGDVLGSISGKAPMNYGTRANFRAVTATRGTGWRQQDYDIVSAIQLLYLVEYADFYSQSMIGNGLTDWSSAWPAWSNSNPIEKTGLSNSLGNATGNVSNGNGVVGSYMSYRGIENFYGHVWKWVDGINVNADVPYVSNVDTDFADDTATNYTALGITLINANGYQNTLEQQPRGFLPASVGASSSTKITDYYYQSTGWRVTKLGGNTNNGANAGVACWDLDDASGDLDRHIGARVSW